MHDVEHHTICYLRDLLVSPAHADPEVTAFLTLWNFEEFWHGEALAAGLAAHGQPSGTERLGVVRIAIATYGHGRSPCRCSEALWPAISRRCT